MPKSLPTQQDSKLLQKLWSFKRGSDVAVGGIVTMPFAVTAEALALADLRTGDIVSAPGQYDLVFSDGGSSNRTVGLTIEGTQQVLEPFPAV